jgi:hypothetical protein
MNVKLAVTPAILLNLLSCWSACAGSAAEATVGDARPAWAQAVPSREWYELKDTQYRAAITKLVPKGKYLGYDPIGATVNSFNDPVANADNSAVFFFGGGHNAGTLNGLFKFDTLALSYSMVMPPTPPSKYPPGYTEGTGVKYPSGVGGYFMAKLTDPQDLPYQAPQDAPVASHMYTASDMRGDTIYYFYGSYKRANTKTGQWEQLTGVDIGAQLVKLTPDKKYSHEVLQQGTAAVYDDKTDRFLVSLVPGDAGINWRGNRLFLWDPIKEVIDPSGPTDGLVPIYTRSSMNLLKAGRWAYMLMCNAPKEVAPDALVNGAFRYNFDTRKIEVLRIEGDLFKYSGKGPQETVPCVYHAGTDSLIRWSYVDDVNALYSVDLKPVGGKGTMADPYVLKQTRIPLKGALKSPPLLNYRRMFYNAKTDAMLFLPNADSNWYAVKL